MTIFEKILQIFMRKTILLTAFLCLLIALGVSFYFHESADYWTTTLSIQEDNLEYIMTLCFTNSMFRAAKGGVDRASAHPIRCIQE